MHVLDKLARFGRKSPREKWGAIKDTIRYQVVHPVRLKANTALLNRGWRIPQMGNDRTAYVIGLFGTGRWYINTLLLYNLGTSIRCYSITSVKGPATSGTHSSSILGRHR